MFFIFFSFKKGYLPSHYNIIFRTSCKSVGFAFISSVIFLFIDCFTSQSHANPKGTQSEGKRRVGAKAGIRQRLLTSGKKIVLYNLGRDKYFRLLASVKVGNIDVAEYLIKKGLAKEYDGGSKVW